MDFMRCVDPWQGEQKLYNLCFFEVGMSFDINEGQYLKNL